MNQYVTGAVIKNLREKNRLTQAELAERLCVSDKTISKWETAKGYPDISYHGEQAWYAQFENYNRHLGIMYCGLYEQKQDKTPDDFIYIAYNMHWITHEFALPILPKE